MTSQITGGSVRYMERAKTGDYEYAEAELSFNIRVDDGDSHQGIAREAAVEAMNITRSMLGLSNLTLSSDRRRTGRPPKASPPAGEPAKPALQQAVEAVNDPAEVVANPTPAPQTPGSAAGQPAPAGASDPATIVDNVTQLPGPAGSTPSPAPSQTSSGHDPAAIVDESLFMATVAEITDKRLMDEIMAMNTKLQPKLGEEAPRKIRAKIGDYVTPPGQARDIPQAKRAAFLADLATLAKLAA